MSGYDVLHVNPQDIIAKHYCSLCERLLRKPVQVITGEFAGSLYCQACIPERVLDYRFDRAVQREIQKLRVYCCHRGCQWQGRVEQYQQHFENCQSKQSKNDIDKENRLLKEENAKLQRENARLKRQSPLSSRNSREPTGSFITFPSLSEEQAVEPKLCTPLAEIKDVKTHIVQQVMERPSATPTTAQHEMPPKSSDFHRRIAQWQASTSSLIERSKRNENDSNHFEQDLQQHKDEFGACTRLSALGNLDFPSPQKIKIYHVSCNDFTVFTERPLNGSGMQCRWRIPDVTEKLAYARNNPDEPLISPPWCTSHSGCVVRALIYLNGDGRGSGTHVSTFMTAVPGPYDNVIPWPIDGTFVFVLLDHENNTRPILQRVCSKRPFKKPPPLLDKQEEMNEASGCPQFTPIATLSSANYVKNNTMIWEFSFHPTKKLQNEE